MKKYIALTSVLLLSLFLLSCAKSQSKDDGVFPAASDIHFKEIPIMEVNSGDKITLNLSLINDGVKSVRYIDGKDVFHSLNIKVMDDKDSDVPLNAYGKKVNPFVLPQRLDSSGINIGPKKQLSFYINLGALFDFSMPGDYSVDVSCFVKPDGNAPQKIVAEPMHIHVEQQPVCIMKE